MRCMIQPVKSQYFETLSSKKTKKATHQAGARPYRLVIYPPTDGGVDAGMDSGTPPPLCSRNGQECGDTQSCCSGYNCTAPGGLQSCGAGETDCTCTSQIIIM